MPLAPHLASKRFATVFMNNLVNMPLKNPLAFQFVF
jgi:hypothetical protein